MTTYYNGPDADYWEGQMSVRCDQAFTLVRTNSLGFDEDIDIECMFEGTTTVAVSLGRVTFECPDCGRENDQPVERYEDGPDGPDTLKEAWGEA